MDNFTLAYIEAALWSTMDESTPDGGEPPDANYGIDDIDPATLAKMVEDCQLFQAANAADLKYGSREWSDAELGGHDFWLTRNHHGAGYWDGDLPEEVGNRLTKVATGYGECDLYVGDDGRIYCLNQTRYC